MRKVIYIVLLTAIVVGCKTSATIVVPEVHTRDSVQVHTRLVHDTTYIDHYHSVVSHGDTVYVRDSIYVYDGHQVETGDTVVVNHTDSIPVEVPVEKTVEVPAKLSLWEQLLIKLGILMAVLIVGTVIYGAVKLYKRLRR